MAIDDINRKATIINQINKVLEKQIKMETVNEIKINYKNIKN